MFTMDYFSGRRFSSKASKIDDNVYLSSIEVTEDSKLLKSLEIKRIITLDFKPLEDRYKQPDIIYKFVKVFDNPKEDLLSRFEECYQFISEGVSKGEKVLVHCLAGISRSATIVVSYFMIKNGLSVKEAMVLVRKKRSIIYPNDGFRRQLELFEKFNRKLDPLNKEYRQYLLNWLRYQMFGNNPWFKNLFTSDASEHLDTFFMKLKTSDETDDKSSEESYKCKKCRNYLFSELNVIQVLDKTDEELKNVCNAIFIEPLIWLKDSVGRLQTGSIDCPKCSSKLGHFDWHNGLHCQCDRHKSSDCLLFRIDANKVDPTLNHMFSSIL